MTLYLSRYSRPDISNATRELSKGMVKANEAHYKQMLRLIRFDIFFVGFFFGRATRNLMKLDSNFQRWSILLQNKILSVLVPVVAATLALVPSPS